MADTKLQSQLQLVHSCICNLAKEYVVTTLDDVSTRRLTPGDTELHQARSVVEQLSSRPLDHWIVSSASEPTVSLPSELSGLLTSILQTIARGGTVVVGSMPKEVTTTTAAEQLGVSRPTLMKMIAKDEILSHKVGSHTRLKSADVTEFKRARLQRQRQAFAELLALEEQADASD